MVKRWAEAELRFLKDNAEKMSVQALADALSVRIDELEKKMEKLGLIGGIVDAPAPKKAQTVKELSRHAENARKDYDRGVASLQKKKLDEAERHFLDLIQKYPEERELVDRARVYLTVCQRQRRDPRRHGIEQSEEPVPAWVRTVEDRVMDRLVEQDGEVEDRPARHQRRRDPDPGLRKPPGDGGGGDQDRELPRRDREVSGGALAMKLLQQLVGHGLVEPVAQVPRRIGPMVLARGDLVRSGDRGSRGIGAHRSNPPQRGGESLLFSHRTPRASPGRGSRP